MWIDYCQAYMLQEVLPQRGQLEAEQYGVRMEALKLGASGSGM